MPSHKNQGLPTDLIQTLMRSDALSDKQSAAIFSLLFSERLTRTELRSLRIEDVDFELSELTVEKEHIALSPISCQALSLWLTTLQNEGEAKEQSEPLFRYLAESITVTDQELSAQNLHYLINRHDLFEQARRILPRDVDCSVLALFAKKVTPPEFGYTPNNLRFIRSLYNLSQKEVSEMLGVGFRTAHAWEINDSAISSKRDMSNVYWERLLTLLYEQDEQEKKQKRATKATSKNDSATK